MSVPPTAIMTSNNGVIIRLLFETVNNRSPL
ncbi:Uncharacterised protein [Mycobacterium tuberculosis]|nr:Uncharacterised protein [Mycobacterium tuberculosis]